MTAVFNVRLFCRLIQIKKNLRWKKLHGTNPGSNFLVGSKSPNPRHWNTGLASGGVSLTSGGKGVSLTLVGQPFSNGVTIIIPYGVDVLLYQPALHPINFAWSIKVINMI